MSQYSFIFIGSIVSLLLINISCKAPDSNSRSRPQGKKIQEEKNNLPNQPSLEIALYNVPNIIAAGSDSGLFYINKPKTKRDIQVKNSQDIGKSILRITKNENGETVELKIKAVPKSNPTLFYFSVPKNFPLGKYDVILSLKDFPDVQNSYSFKVVDEKELNLTKIKSIQIKSLQQFRLINNFKIPIGKCIDLLATAKTSVDKIVYNITKESWLIKNIIPSNANFTLTDNMKICAYLEKSGQKLYPQLKEEVNFNISYEGIDSSVKLIVTENPGKTSGQEDSVLTTNLSIDIASKASDSETTILPTFEALVADEEVIPTPEHLVVDEEVIPTPETLVADEEVIPTPETLVVDEEVIPTPEHLLVDEEVIPTPEHLLVDEEVIPTPETLVVDEEVIPTPETLVVDEEVIPTPETLVADEEAHNSEDTVVE